MLNRMSSYPTRAAATSSQNRARLKLLRAYMIGSKTLDGLVIGTSGAQSRPFCIGICTFLVSVPLDPSSA